MTKEQRIEWLRCKQDRAYFIHKYCLIYNATVKKWIPFRLWEAQTDVLREFLESDLLIILKARQLGLTWLTLCHLLAEMIFEPAATVLIFSKRDDEAVELLSERLKGIHEHLPDWMQQPVAASNEHMYKLANGSRALAFPTTGGRSYTASHVLIDEGDFMPKLGSVMNAVQPTIDAGGQMIIISTVDKEAPGSTFKNMFAAAERGETTYKSIFLPWHARPSRTAKWYQARVADSLAKDQTLDSVHQEYPATVEEALSALSFDKRFSPGWLSQVYRPMQPLHVGPAVVGLSVYHVPSRLEKFVIGADPAEGNPSSDDSAATVVNLDTGEEVASLRGKFEPTVFAGYIDTLSKWYNNAPVMVERNNHGHAVLVALAYTNQTRRLVGRDRKFGWLNNQVGKTMMYDALAELVRDNALAEEGRVHLIHSRETYIQLASIEGETLSAPQGFHDDLADSFALAEVGRAAASIRAETTQPSISTRSF